MYAETRDIRLLGFVLFLLADCVLFSSFIFAYLYLRTSAPDWPPFVDGQQIARLDVAFAAMNSVVLFGSGATMHYALESWKHLKQTAFNLLDRRDDPARRRLPRRPGLRVPVRRR